MGAGPPRAVDGRNARPPRAGLLASAERPNEPDSVWNNGIRYEPECVPEPGGPLDPCSTGTLDEGDRPEEIHWEPYVIHGPGYQCSAIGLNPTRQGEIEARARRFLASSQEFSISREFWTGETATAEDLPNRFLADDVNVDRLAAEGTGLTHGLACLTQALAETNGGQRGMIHATPQVVTHWAGLDLLERAGDVLVTRGRGDIVVPGSGYTGSNPDGEGPFDGEVWAYATDLVEVRLGSPRVLGADPEGIDRTRNLLVVRAERLALASWDGCRHFGVPLDVVLCDIGGAS